MAKLRKALAKPEDWQRHMRVLDRLAAPKVAVRPKKKPVRNASLFHPYPNPDRSRRGASGVRPDARHRCFRANDPLCVCLSLSLALFPLIPSRYISEQEEKRHSPGSHAGNHRFRASDPLSVSFSRVPLPPPTFQSKRRKKWRPVNVERLEALAQPAIREAPEIRDPFAVAPRALTYKISKRIEEIAFRKKPPEILPRTPGAVSPAALIATGTYARSRH